MDVNFVQTIVRDKRGVQGLKPIVYGFASNTSVRTHNYSHYDDFVNQNADFPMRITIANFLSILLSVIRHCQTDPLLICLPFIVLSNRKKECLFLCFCVWAVTK